jgi:hypothetical protein
MRWMNVRPAFESGRGLSPTTALQDAGARIGQSREKLPTVTYTRGNDLSGSLEGAGGIGGMLARSHSLPFVLALAHLFQNRESRLFGIAYRQWLQFCRSVE